MNAGLGIYVHWPYCARICPYCDFNVYRDRGAGHDVLIDAILLDLAAHAERMGRRRADTLYLGGGTPSLLAPEDVARLVGAAQENFALAPDAEVTLEANPEDRRRFADFVAAGVNRLSLGVQALDDGALKALGRLHDAAGARAAADAAAKTGARLSLDFIYARAGQSIGGWREELAEALRLPAEHFSLYELNIKPGTAFERAVWRGALKPPGNDLAADFYETTQEICEAAGLPAYEISNHARTSAAQSRHNLIYWRGGEWLGLGPGAHGRIESGRQRLATKGPDKPDAYVAAVNARGVGWESAEALTAEEIARERLIMGLRAAEGVPGDTPGIDAGKVAALAQAGLIVAGERIALTRAGRLVADRIAADLSV